MPWTGSEIARSRAIAEYRAEHGNDAELPDSLAYDMEANQRRNRELEVACRRRITGRLQPWNAFPPRVVAFLQNCYVRHSDVRSWARMMVGPRRHPIISRGLFAGCKTGQVLRRGGLDGMPWIVWDNASPGIGTRASHRFPPDPEHMAKVINQYSPLLVIALGNDAQRGLEQLDLTGCEVMVGPHPAARMNVWPALTPIARKVEEIYEDVTGATRA